MRITSHELRTRYLEFFGARGHVALAPASLVPANDPTVLFTTAGMHPLVPYLLGEPHPAGTRLVDVQKCIRTGDIEVIGDDTHLTFFEMLGNWSLGDYGRDDAIAWSFEFLVDALALPLDRLGVTCHTGDDDSVRIWTALGMPRDRIQRLDDNWWGPAGRTGPCGPDTEIFYWVGDEPAPRVVDVADARWVEIWNNVFMSFTKTATGDLVPLPRANVDTGMGLERTLVALTGVRSVYDVDTIAPVYRAVRRWVDDERDARVLCDHVRAASFIVTDGIEPANKDRGYVVRRLVRRGGTIARRHGVPPDWYRAAIDAIEPGPYALDRERAARVIGDELRAFDRTLEHGARMLERHDVIDGKLAFDLFQTHGYPFELTRELAQRAGKHVDEDGFRRALDDHRERSRTATGTFAGGLADHSVEIVRYHTLTHLLHAALRAVLGDHVIQRGSNITRDRLRFDFSHDRKPAADELARVQALVEGWLARDFVVERTTMTEPEARALGALGAFGEKYGDVVSVYTIRERGGGVLSRELCGGPHVASSGELHGRFRIVREQAVSAGVRRIKAVLEPAP